MRVHTTLPHTTTIHRRSRCGPIGHYPPPFPLIIQHIPHTCFPIPLTFLSPSPNCPHSMEEPPPPSGPIHFSSTGPPFPEPPLSPNRALDGALSFPTPRLPMIPPSNVVLDRLLQNDDTLELA